MVTGLTQIIRWTAVTDAVPGSGIPVLASAEPQNGGMTASQVYQARYISGGWISDEAGLLSRVTHWAAYPAPPDAGQVAAVLAELTRRKEREAGLDG